MPPLNSLSKSCLALAIGQAMIMPTHGATIEVNSSLDDDAAGACTLRQAVVSANTDAIAASSNCVAGDAGGDTITFANSVITGGSILLT